nr:MAG TPA: hypothetical protein [Caudoviricetes sp.]
MLNKKELINAFCINKLLGLYIVTCYSVVILILI